MAKRKDKKHDTQEDFSPHLLEAINRPPAPMPRIVLYVLLVLLSFVLIWSFVGQLDIVARAQGKLIPKTRLKIVQPFEGGRIAEIRVHDGELVRAGQTLLVMDTRLSDADTRKLENELQLARLQLSRVEAELEGTAFASSAEATPTAMYAQVAEQYRTRRQDYLNKLNQQKAQLNEAEQDLASAQEIFRKLKETLPIHRKNERAVRDLGKKGFASQSEILDKERIRIEAERDLRSQRFRMESLESKIEQARQRIKQLKSNYRDQLVTEQIKLQRQIVQLEQDLVKQEYRNELMEIKAPEDGFVKDLTTNTPGTVVPAGSVLLNVVPVDEPLQAEVYIENKDVGFVTEGQAARIKLASYSFQKYGMIDARVNHVSADANTRQGEGGPSDNPAPGQLGYRTIVTLDQQFLEKEGQRFRLRPGMQVTAEIKMGTRSVMDYVLSPVQKTILDAGMER